MLPEHQVFAAGDRRWDGWDRLTNGDLLRAAENEAFDVMVTGDKKIVYQQNNRIRKISLVVLSITDWQIIRYKADLISAAITRAIPGSYEYLLLEPGRQSKRIRAVE